LSLAHILAVFRAEYYTTTSKFRKYRQYIPILFLSGVVFFSLILRTIYGFLIVGDGPAQAPPIGSFFAIISVFSYFTLFAPLLSPLGRIVYDASARSQREVAISAPVKGRDLLYGNLLSNLAFFLPFFSFIGTVSLAPFIGNGEFSGVVTAIFLFFIMTLLILIGLVTGTLISPIIFNFIGKQKSEFSRAFVTLSVSSLMIVSLPLLRYLLDQAESDSSLGAVAYLPFTVASSLIVYVLYGEVIGLDPLLNIVLMLGYVVIIFIVGWITADWLYSLDEEGSTISFASRDSKKEKFLNFLVLPVPKTLRTPTMAIMKASFRDIEHMSRLTIGVAVTVFMVFALSGRGLFRGTQNFSGNIESAIVLFSIVLSAASVIFIEASSFIVNHRDMFTLIKSAPSGPRKFILSKAIQMNYIIIPVFTLMIFALSLFDFIQRSSLGLFILFSIVILITLISVSLMIYLVNPSDNQEDLTNFINLLIFYVFAFFIATIPVVFTINESTLTPFRVTVYLSTLIVISVISLIIAIVSLDQMNLETLDSNFSLKLKHGFKVFVMFITGWNFVGLAALPYLLITEDVIGFAFLTLFFTASLPLIFWKFRLVKIPKIKLPDNILTTIRMMFTYVGGMLIISFILLLIIPLPSQSVETTQLFGISEVSSIVFILLIITTVIFEEIFFRGFLQDYAELKLTKNQALIMTSVIFGILHPFSLVSFVNAIILGGVLVMSRRKSDSLMVPIIIHLSFNTIILLLASL